MILVDAGPLVAVLVERDQHRAACTEALSRIQEPLGTVWPAIAEAMFLVSRWPEGAARLWQMLDDNVELLPLGRDDWPRMRELMQKYHDLPMDLTDAAIVRVAERENIETIFTIDRRDFQVYRLLGRRRFKIIP